MAQICSCSPGGQVSGRIADGDPADGHDRPRRQRRVDVNDAMDAHLGPRADGAAGEQRGPGWPGSTPLAHPGPVQVRVRSDQHVVADHRRMPGPPADQGVLHHHRAVTDRDLAVFGGVRTAAMENALVRGRAGHAAMIGDDVLVGPHAHLNGTRATVVPGHRRRAVPRQHRRRGAEVRIHGVVHVTRRCRRGRSCPSAGSPSAIRPGSSRPASTSRSGPSRNRSDFPGTVYGTSPRRPATERMSRQAAWYGAHLDDRPL